MIKSNCKCRKYKNATKSLRYQVTQRIKGLFNYLRVTLSLRVFVATKNIK